MDVTTAEVTLKKKSVFSDFNLCILRQINSIQLLRT